MSHQSTSDATSLVHAICTHGEFGHPVRRMVCEQTHMSWVFLTGDFAYKIKKPVKFAFADFSSLERRRHFCAEELRINRRLSPQLYVDVVPIGGSRERPVFGREPAFEYAVKLVQFDPAQRLDKQLEAGVLSAADLRNLAQTIWTFQQGLPIVAAHADVGSAAFVTRLATVNLAELAVLRDDDAQSQRLARWTHAQCTSLHKRFAQRHRDGAIREGHGDLHLQNLVRFDGQIVPFDALEFSQDLRSMDTLDEVAFLAMDVMARGRDDLACEFLSAYLECAGDYGAVDLLRFYLVYRALVRAKVEALRHATGSDADSDDRYLRQALALIAPQRPALILAHGLSGSGKTTVLGQLIGPLRALRLRSDLERKRRYGLAVSADSTSPVGGGLYSAAATKETYRILAGHARRILDAGFSVLVDAAFLRRAQRDHFRALARAAGVPVVIVHCTAPARVLSERVARRADAHADASEATPAVLAQQQRTHDPLADDELALTVSVDTAQEMAVERLLGAIQSRCTRAPR